MGCLFQELAGGVKHPDSMTRKEKLKMIASLDQEEAFKFWLNNARGISRKAFNEVRECHHHHHHNKQKLAV